MAVEDSGITQAEPPEPGLGRVLRRGPDDDGRGPGPVHVTGRELLDEEVLVATPRRVSPLLRLGYLVVGLGLFVTALGLMKEGAAQLAPSLEGSVFTDSTWSTLGVGWLGACIVLSGSPVAASALTLLDGGAIDRSQAFTMLMGSRLGASFVVLVAGLVYALRRSGTAGRAAPLSIGVLALIMTGLTYLPGAVVGKLLLDGGSFDGLDIGTSPSVASATDSLFGWAADLLSEVLPGWTLFPIGVLVLLAGFTAFDKVLPALGNEEMEERPDAWYDRKWPMFALGCAVCLLTLSVSVALTVLVPLVASGRLRRANTIPYIAGANITTLADTLVAAILLGNQDAVRVVVAVTASVTVWTVLLLTFAYPALRRASLGITNAALRSPRHLGVFVLVLLAVPVGLIAA